VHESWKRNYGRHEEAASVDLPRLGACLPILGDPQTHRLGAGLSTGPHIKLAKNRRDVVADRPLGEEEALGDFAIAEAVSDKLQDLDLAARQAAGVLLRGPTRTTG
jgi:hypothetical protein